MTECLVHAPDSRRLCFRRGCSFPQREGWLHSLATSSNCGAVSSSRQPKILGRIARMMEKKLAKSQSLAVAIGIYWLVSWLHVHRTRRARMVDQSCFALNVSVCNFTDLVALGALPTLARKLFRKCNNAFIAGTKSMNPERTKRWRRLGFRSRSGMERGKDS